MTRVLFPILTGGVIVILSLGWFNSCDREKRALDEQYNTTRKAENVEKIKNAAIAERDSLDARRVKKMKSDSLDNVRVTDSLKRASNRFARRYADLKAQIRVIGDSIPVVREFENVSDSTIQAKEAELLQCQQFAIARDKDFIARIGSAVQNLADQKEVTEAWRTAAESEGKKARKEERRKKFFRTTTVILLGAVGILAVTQ